MKHTMIAILAEFDVPPPVSVSVELSALLRKTCSACCSAFHLTCSASSRGINMVSVGVVAGA